MNYSIFDYLRDTNRGNKRPNWQLWLFIGVMLAAAWLAVKPPGGVVPLLLLFLFWLWHNYRIQLSERKRKPF